MSRRERSSRSTRRRPSRGARPHLKGAAAAVGVVLVGAALFAGFRGDDASRSGTAEATTPPPVPVLAPRSVLEADHVLHEFGSIPIDGGLVESSFVVTNTGDEPARIVATHTSCMCTTATLTFPDGTTEGPFGMEGHELPVTLDRVLGAGEAMTMRVRFDPAAHGPDATGPVQRGVAVQTDGHEALVVRLSANVVSE